MINLKKVLSILCIAAILWALSITAFAVDNTTNTGSQIATANTVDSLKNRAAKLDKRLQYLQLKQSLEQKRDTVRESRDANKALLIQNTQLRKDIVDLLTALKQNGGTLSADIKEQIKTYNQQIKDITSALKETKGSIKDILAANKENVKNLDYDAIDAAFSQIASIQSSRNAQLAKINQILMSIKSLLTTAA